jgi:hypothetical protein
MSLADAMPHALRGAVPGAAIDCASSVVCALLCSTPSSVGSTLLPRVTSGGDARAFTYGVLMGALDGAVPGAQCQERWVDSAVPSPLVLAGRAAGARARALGRTQHWSPSVVAEAVAAVHDLSQPVSVVSKGVFLVVPLLSPLVVYVVASAGRGPAVITSYGDGAPAGVASCVPSVFVERC